MTKYDEQNLLIIRRDHEIFPLIWSFSGDHANIAYAAMDNVTVRVVDRKLLQEYRANNPKIEREILESVLSAYRVYSQRVQTLSFRTVRERIASFILHSADRFGRQVGDEIYIDAPLRQSDIAYSINSARETTSRELSVLHKKGYVRTDSDHTLVILDHKKLKSIIK
jgi:CRP-like cAMP-binding protein